MNFNAKILYAITTFKFCTSIEFFESFTKLNNNFESYTQWIVNSFPDTEKIIRCIDIVYTEPNHFTETFLNIFMNEILIQTRIRNIFSHQPDNIHCEFFILLATNSETFFRNITSWSLGKRFKYFLIIIPKYVIKSDLYEEDPLKWTLYEILYHPNAMLIFGDNVYKLSTPYQRKGRHFLKSSIDDLKTWKLINITGVNNFGGVHLNISSTNNPPHHFWMYKNKTVFPKVGNVEIACQYKEGQPLYGNRDCSEYLQ